MSMSNTLAKNTGLAFSVRALVAAVFAMTLSGLLAADVPAAPAPTLDSLRLELDVNRQAFHQPVATLNTQYEAQLKKLEEDVRKAGELNLLLAVQDELKGFASGEAKPAPSDFGALQKLQDIYRPERAKREKAEAEQLVPFLAKYREALTTLQKRLTQENQVAEAIKVQDEVVKLDAWRQSVAGFLDGAKKGKPATIPLRKPDGIKGGRLRGFGDLGRGLAADVSKAKQYSDIVGVTIVGEGWMALRDGGEVISNRAQYPTLEEEKAVALGTGFPMAGGTFTILRNGKIATAGVSFPLPAEFARTKLACRKIERSDGCAIALFEDGSVKLWGPIVEKAGAIPPPDGLASGVVDIAVFSGLNC